MLYGAFVYYKYFLLFFYSPINYNWQPNSFDDKYINKYNFFGITTFSWTVPNI